MQGVAVLTADIVPDLREHLVRGRTPALVMMQRHRLVDPDERRVGDHRRVPSSNRLRMVIPDRSEARFPATGNRVNQLTRRLAACNP
ncbi:hypothetical protein [Nocardia sienata]|uniref:hypothetical protein n=1 Tax=Nocardia sienata TaxID=248552 RepID=UPI0007A468B3|nr:hypothetical protein [Nocardia sienata]